MGGFTRHGQAVSAKVAASPLQQGQFEVQAQGVAQPGQVTKVELVLQTLGGRADQRALARQQQGHQVRKCLAHASAGFHHQAALRLKRYAHAVRKRQLHLAMHEAWVVARQRAVVGKNGVNALRKSG